MFLIKYLLFLLFFSVPSFASTLGVSIESGAVWQARNDVKISGDTGTLFSFDNYNSGPFFHYRIEADYQTNGPHGLRLVYAPLSLSVSGTEGKDLVFNNKTFAGSDPISVDYKFNSYRIGYTYLLWRKQSSFFKLGLTGKVRDASISVEQNNKRTTYDNLGFVPLFYYGLKVNLSSSWYLFSDADFAYASQGRAIDFSFKFRRRLSPSSSIGVGVRALEGGAENDKVLTFTFAQYGVIDLVMRW